MTFALDKIEFDNDIFSNDLADGSILVINRINEALSTDNLVNAPDTIIDRFNIQIVGTDGITTNCSSVIGLEDAKTKISTEYKQYEGTLLDSNNISYCTLEVFEDED